MNKKKLRALLKRKMSRLQKLNTRMKKNEVRDEDLEEVQEEVDELAEEVQELNEIIEELEDDIEDIDAELTEEERANRKKRASRAKKFKRRKRSKRDGTEEEIAKELQGEIDDLIDDVEELIEAVEELEDDVEVIEENLDEEARAKIQKLIRRAKRAKRKKRDGMSDEDAEELQDEIDELAELVDELIDDVDVIEGDVEDIEEELDEEARGKRNGHGVTPRQRSAASRAVRSSLSTRNASPMTKKDAQIRSAFANFVVGKINESEARSLGIEVGNGSVTIPKVIASEVITYAQEENLLRKYGTVVQTKDTQGYPILVKKAVANINKGERSTNIAETEIEFDEVTLNPAEFDALATVTKKLLARADVPVEDIVVDELKKAYVRKETNYMFNGDDAGHENPGALAKKAVSFYENKGDDLYDSLIKLKNTPVTEVVKAARWIINRAALTLIETMKTADGFPLLRPFEAPEGGIKHTLLGYEFDFTDDADAADPTKAVFYFGDFSQFRIQDVMGSMEIQRLVEAYSAQNKVGFQIYNVVDGQLIYSPLAPAVYRYEVGATAPVGS